MTNTGPRPLTVRALLTRALDCCEACGKGVSYTDRGLYWSVQHRRARGMGGTTWPGINLASNLMVLCGSATTPGSCHAFAESRVDAAELAGYFVRWPTDPATVRVLIRRSWFYLTNDFTYAFEPPALAGDGGTS